MTQAARRSSTGKERIRNAVGFVLIEVMLGVAIFATGVLALGECVNHCVRAETAKNEDWIARIALSNRLAEIEGKSFDASKNSEQELKGMFKGIIMKQRVKPLVMKNEKKEAISGLFQVDMEAVWKSPTGEEQSKVLSIYVHRS